LKNIYTPPELQIITFDAAKLGPTHLPIGCEAFNTSVCGLNSDEHLKSIIENNITHIDISKASADICAVVRANKKNLTKCILLECTNLQPYKSDIRRISDVPIYDILTAIEKELPDSVNPYFL